ncbi:STAS domain-containing protein [Chitinasiproducens palmae]|uniref:RsbT co-antagonist protein RsbR n=1 Tax=Chitinasiproducens palmae TaxID=1770053 RepID=A0A1H2PN57_9BURK|nr:STAS domain-containing protein [Chitinasiproducens palmae]SDV48077.1 rsbT co-antagonist protein RsbR [Chitinasiproducens palmae]
MAEPHAVLASILDTQQQAILSDWLAYQLKASTLRRDLMREGELREQSARFLDALKVAIASGAEGDEDWAEVQALLESVSRSRAQQGFSPSETATFVLSLKQPLFERVASVVGDAATQRDVLWYVTTVLDRLALITAEAYQNGREQIIMRQQQELLDLSTPVVELYEGILALPLIGTLDSERTQVVMENLLGGIVQKEAAIAIIDITGVPTVDTLVAQHLLKTIAAARLMGAECIISGIRPQIAQTIVHLGVDLGSVVTKATLAAAFSVALAKRNLIISRRTKAPAERRSGGASE